MPWLAVGIRLPQAQVILGVNVERDLVLGSALVRKPADEVPGDGTAKLPASRLRKLLRQISHSVAYARRVLIEGGDDRCLGRDGDADCALGDVE